MAIFSLVAVPLPAAERVALVIGNADYKNAVKLVNPLSDAQKLEGRLKEAGFATDLVTDADIDQLTQRLELFYASAAGAEAAMVFYAGHGIENEGENYLLPVDANLNVNESLSGDALSAAKRAVLKRETVPLNGLLRDLGRSGAKLKLVVLDCCRNDPLPSRSWLSRSGAGGTLAEVGEKALTEGTMLVFSTAPGKVAADGPRGGNSPFTAALLETLTPGASMLQVFTATSSRMERQEPWIKFDGSGRAMAGFGSYALIPGTSSSGGMVQRAAQSPGAATREKPFVNSLGMRFVPTIDYTDGSKVFFCQHEARVRDYGTYASEKGGVDVSYKNPSFSQTEEHPVVYVAWEDAKAFCAWLTNTERAAGWIGAKDEYRLPRDHEWSLAVGIGEKEDARASPKEKDEKILGVYPWGGDFPPGVRDGNFYLSGGDGYENTAPVMSYGANRFGLYDLGGNVWEWCEDWYEYDPAEPKHRVLRGASSCNGTESDLRSSCRDCEAPRTRSDDDGFRVVLVVAGG